MDTSRHDEDGDLAGTTPADTLGPDADLMPPERWEERATIQNAREDAAGWEEASLPLQGRQYFAYSGVGLMLRQTAGTAERALNALEAAEARLARAEECIATTTNVLQVHAISAHAIGHSDYERKFLDTLAVLADYDAAKEASDGRG